MERDPWLPSIAATLAGYVVYMLSSGDWHRGDFSQYNSMFCSSLILPLAVKEDDFGRGEDFLNHPSASKP